MKNNMYPPRAKADIEQLKRNWEKDPCWDIEYTEGFEANREELLAYRKEYEKKANETWGIKRKQLIKDSHVFPLDHAAIEILAPFNGLTKRELFAAMAMQGFLINPDYNDANHEQTAEMAIKAAEALLNRLNKE
ncbi:MAG: hypothetical protein ACK5M3_05420 [Dysgonomonas sp.]